MKTTAGEGATERATTRGEGKRVVREGARRREGATGRGGRHNQIGVVFFGVVMYWVILADKTVGL